MYLVNLILSNESSGLILQLNTRLAHDSRLNSSLTYNRTWYCRLVWFSLVIIPNYIPIGTLGHVT